MSDNLSALFLEHANGYRTERALDEMRCEILEAFKAGSAVPTTALLEELAEINIALGDVKLPRDHGSEEA